ncbi:MAG: alpha/beta hydrolase [Saprospiraceae bacterium]
MNIWLIVIICCCLLLAFLYQYKGTLLHEILHLPEYWWNVLPTDTSQMQEQKISFGEHPRQYFLWCTPLPDRPRSDKVIIWLHGGGWQHGKAEMFRANAQVLTKAGHSVALMSYRLAPKFNYYAMREDLDLFLPKLLQTIDYQNIKPKIIAGGMSSGATLAALLLYDRTALARLGLSQNIFAAAALFGAPLDLSGMPDNYVLRAYAGRKDSEQFHLANPITHLTEAEHIPLLIVQGKRDGLVNYRQVESFLTTLRQVQKSNIEVHWFEEYSHLDIVRWNYQVDEVQLKLLSWLAKI